ncbi:hypothetical protein ADUPG1_002589, partial [Aduncisulcus paluster]
MADNAPVDLIIGYQTILDKDLFQYLKIPVPSRKTLKDVELDAWIWSPKDRLQQQNAEMTLGFLVEESMVEVVKPVLECFLTNESKASKKIPPLKIRIKKGEVFKTRACRRIPRAHKEFLKQEIKTLLHDGIISDSEGEFFSPIVIVPKKGGKLRLCIDFRDLNKVT